MSMQECCTTTGTDRLKDKTNREKAVSTRRQKKIDHDSKILPFIKHFRTLGYGYKNIALKLNMWGFITLRGKRYDRNSIGMLWYKWN